MDSLWAVRFHSLGLFAIGQEEPLVFAALFIWFLFGMPDLSDATVVILGATAWGLLGAFLAFVGALPIVHEVRVVRNRRYPNGSCQSCGYNLTGNESGKCPECGTNVDQAES